MGVDRLPNLAPSRICSILGPDLLVPFTAVQVPGRVIWCNFELARSLGFHVPQSNRMDAALEEELIQAFSYRALPSGEDPAGRVAITMLADRYGGDGVAPALGSARGGFYPYCDAFGKGIGFTPLFRHDNPADFVHSHGGMEMHEAFHEALWGEVNGNLFSGRTTRALVLIDQGGDIVYPEGWRFPRALAIRVGDHLRPGHVLAARCWKRQSRLDVFLAIVRETGQLVLQEGGRGEPDLQATILRIIDDHARIAARQVRWRITHCYLSASNMRMDGGMLDHNTLRSNPRLPPIAPDRSFDPDRAFYGDYIDRTRRITTLYRTLRLSLREEERRRLNAAPVRVGKAMDAAYLKQLEQELLCAAGLKSGIASRIRQSRPDGAARFAAVLIAMTLVTNRAARKANRTMISDVAALDVFGLLAAYPRTFFASPDGDHTEMVWDALAPRLKGDRLQRARKRATVEALVSDFAAAYRDLMSACRDFAGEFYGDPDSMRSSIQARAAFENRPIDPLFQPTLWEPAGTVPNTRSTRGLASEYRATGDPRTASKALDDLIAESVRNTEELLCRGNCRRLCDGGIESQILVVEGVRYAVRSGFLHVSIPVRCEGSAYKTSIDCFPILTEAAVRRLRLRFTTNAWETAEESPAVLDPGGVDGMQIAFPNLRSSAPVGELRGFLYLVGQDASRVAGPQALRSYAFAIPGAHDLKILGDNLKASAHSAD